VDAEESRLFRFISRFEFIRRFILKYFIWPDGAGVRLAITALFTIVIALFIHLRDDSVVALHVGSKSPRYVVAQTTFSFLDNESTIRLKERAVRDVGTLYWLSKEQIKKARTQFDQYWMQDRSIDREWTRELLIASEMLSEALVQVRFTNVETMRKMKSVHIPTGQTYRPPSNFIEGKSQPLPSDFWNAFAKSIFTSARVSDPVREYIINFYSNFDWALSVDHRLEMHLRELLQKEVAPARTTVHLGETIIARGEKVTDRHVAQYKAMQAALIESRHLGSPVTMLGSLILASMFTLGIYLFFNLRASSVLASSKKLLLYGLIVTLALLIAKVTLAFIRQNPSDMIESYSYPLFVPFAVILICVLLREMSIAIFSIGWLAVLFSMILPVNTPTFLMVNFIASLFCLFNVRGVRKRTEILSMCAKAWIACAAIVIGYSCMSGDGLGTATLGALTSLGFFAGFTGILCIGLLPLLESLFEMMTNITLMEYIDPNHELLRRLSLEAPGTYHHSLLLANLAEAAATSIGANGTFCRVAAMYHDIGKVCNPQYFTENQQGLNPHQLLTPEESAAVIVGHVTEGMRLAREHNLPRSIMNIIREHHGTTLVYYFYQKALERVEGDASRVDEKLFRYHGPKPRSKESAILMIADTVEAAAHTLDDFSEQKLKEVVGRLVAQKAADGQLNHCQLTFEELSRVQRTLIKSLVLANRSRIAYPKIVPPSSSSQVPTLDT